MSTFCRPSGSTGYGFASGTSMATPHVSGAAALVLSTCSLDTAGVKAVLLDSVDVVAGLSGFTMTGGRLNVDKAVQGLQHAAGPPGRICRPSAGTRQVALAWTAASGATTYTVTALPDQRRRPCRCCERRSHERVHRFDGRQRHDLLLRRLRREHARRKRVLSNEVSATPRVPPDLVVPAINAPSKGGAGLPLSVSVTTSNTASAAAFDPTETRLYLSTDYAIDAGDVTLDAARPCRR